MTEREAALEEALSNILRAVVSHVDGRDLLDELHPRRTIDIKVRCDGQDRWFEGDWLSDLRKAVREAREVLDEAPDELRCTNGHDLCYQGTDPGCPYCEQIKPPEVPYCLSPEEIDHRMDLIRKAMEAPVAKEESSAGPVYTLEAIKAKLPPSKPPKKQFHRLKCWPEFFGAIQRGEKRHDLRRNDRNFGVGDLIELWEFDPKGQGFTGLTQDVRITYITAPDSPCAYSEIGLQPGFCILSITTDVEADR